MPICILGRQLRAWRETKKQTLEQVAVRGGLQLSYLSKFERGEVANPQWDTFRRIKKGYGIRIIGNLIAAAELEILAPTVETPAPKPYEAAFVERDVFAVTMKVPLDPQNSMPLSFDYLNEARRAQASRILIYPHEILLSAEQRYRNAREGVEWMQAQGYLPRIALISASPADRAGMDAVRQWGLEADCCPNEADALRWLQSGRAS